MSDGKGIAHFVAANARPMAFAESKRQLRSVAVLAAPRGCAAFGHGACVTMQAPYFETRTQHTVLCARMRFSTSSHKISLRDLLREPCLKLDSSHTYSWLSPRIGIAYYTKAAARFGAVRPCRGLFPRKSGRCRICKTTYFCCFADVAFRLVSMITAV